MTDGFCYIVYGDRAAVEATKSLATLRQHNQQPVTVIGDRALDGAGFVAFENRGTPGRWAKVNLDQLSPYECTCYLDADTIVHGDLSAGFGMLRDGWDLVIAPSVNQGRDWLRHVEEEERGPTVLELGYRYLQLQAGMMFFHREQCARLFGIWRSEWERWQGQDQAALLRALYQEPVKAWLLGQPWSNGELVRHIFGVLR
jgi:hypothetical protein